jgi:flavin-dependent dehydrogenase
MVQRARFDALLVEQALATGCVTLMDETALEGLTQDALGVDVHTSRGVFRARLVIGADGANGQSARLLGALRTRHLMPAIEADIAADAALLERWHDRLQLDIGTLRGAYGWVFPKGDRLNIGVGAICGPGTRGSVLRAYAEAHRLHTVGSGATTLRRVGFVLPLREPGDRIEWGRVLLAGDAAGLVEAFTGEGIYWALRSGRIAAESAAAHIERGTAPGYEQAIDTQLMPDLLAARRWAHLYLWWPRLCHLLPTRSRRVWGGVERLLRGERRFSELASRLGPLAPLAEHLPVRFP